jgi:hypothetical protein
MISTGFHNLAHKPVAAAGGGFYHPGQVRSAALNEVRAAAMVTAESQ